MLSLLRHSLIASWVLYCARNTGSHEASAFGAPASAGGVKDLRNSVGMFKIPLGNDIVTTGDVEEDGRKSMVMVIL